MEKLISLNGFDFKIKRLGQGFPVLMPGSVDFYQKCLPAELLTRFEFNLIDFRGYARTAIPFSAADFSMEKFIQDSLELFHHLKLDRPFIMMGHSSHTLLQLHLFHHLPEVTQKLVKAFVMVGSAPHAWEAYQSSIARWDGLNDPERKVSDSKYQNEFLSQQGSFKAFCKAFHARSWYDFQTDKNSIWDGVYLNDQALDFIYRNVFPTFDLAKHLGEIQIPILSIEGEADYLVAPGSEWEKFGKEIKRCEIKKAGHYPFLENAQDFIKALEQNIQGL